MRVVAIINGPSKFDLAQALLVRKPGRPSVTFTLYSTTVEAFVDSLEAEDNSGESWNLTGYVGNNTRFEAYYRTDKRIGRYKVFA